MSASPSNVRALPLTVTDTLEASFVAPRFVPALLRRVAADKV
jgi:hypothetical protein